MNAKDMVTTTFRTRLKVNKKQETTLLRWAAARRAAFNYALNLCHIYLEECDKTGQPNKLLKMIDEFDRYFNAAKYPLGEVHKTKSEPLVGSGGMAWIREKKVPSSACQLAIKYDLKEAWKKCFRKESRKPHFQSKHRHKSITLSSVDMKAKFIHGDYIELPKGNGKARLGDSIPYANFESGNVSFCLSGDKWYVSFTLHVPASEYYRVKKAKHDVVGVDLGVNIYAATSTEVNYYSPEKLTQLEKRKGYINHKIGKLVHQHLLRVVCECERCKTLVTGVHEKKHLCTNCRDVFNRLCHSLKLTKLRNSVARIAAKQSRIRDNMGHQLTTELVKSNDTIVIENLKVKNMTASASGTPENPGSGVRQKSRLNRTFLNVAPYRFRSMLEYKSDKYGRHLVLVDPAYTSQECSECGYISADNRQSQAAFICQNCGHTSNADTNAAKNIKNKHLGSEL